MPTAQTSSLFLTPSPGLAFPAYLLQLSSQAPLPRRCQTLPFASLTHRALVRLGSTALGRPPQQLSGCDAAGLPLFGAHEHAHLSPLDLDQDGLLDHLLIWGPKGLTLETQAIIRSLTLLSSKDLPAPIALSLANHFKPSTSNQADQTRFTQLAHLCPASGSCVWESTTPFVAPRFLKRNGRNSLDGQIQSECETRGLPAPTQIDVLPSAQQPDAFRAFVRVREGQRPPVDWGYLLRLHFSSPLYGPLALGYAAHFGLGCFHAL